VQVENKGASLTSVHGFDEPNVGTSVQFWCLGLFFGKIQKIQNEFGGEVKSVKGTANEMAHYMQF